MNASLLLYAGGLMLLISFYAYLSSVHLKKDKPFYDAIEMQLTNVERLRTNRIPDVGIGPLEEYKKMKVYQSIFPYAAILGVLLISMWFKH